MQPTFASRIASMAFASLMTLAMLLSVDSLARHGAPQPEMAATTVHASHA